MLLPIDPSTLQSSPRFAVLYQRLTTTILNSDDSIKNSTREAQSQAKFEELVSVFESKYVLRLYSAITAKRARDLIAALRPFNLTAPISRL